MIFLKAIVLDIDGTLLNDQKEIQEKTKASLMKQINYRLPVISGLLKLK